MQCNIDARGKRLRLLSGLFSLAAAVILAVVAVFVGGLLLWLAVGLLLLTGAFQVYEARAGWCVVRAMGFKTPV